MDGSGTLGDPYIITNATDLQAMETGLDKYYLIDRDINASITATWNGGDGFDPVGQEGTPFTGQLDGGGHAVSGLTIDRTEDIDFGLFGYLSGATVLNLHLTNVDIIAIAPDPSTDYVWVGALAALCMNGSSVSDCSVQGDIASTTRDDAGGMFGQINNSVVTRCWADVDLDVDEDYSENSKGGFAGYITDTATVSKCYALGSLDLNCTSGTFFYGSAGGFVGFNEGDIDDCYARGNVTVTSADESNDDGYVGGFVGLNYPAGATIDNSYSTGIPSASAWVFVGGFCGDNDGGTISNSFWDTTTSGEGASDGGTGKVTAQMKTKSTFVDAGWDFVSPIWGITPSMNSGYPYFGPSLSEQDSVDQTIIGNKVSLEAIRNLEIVYGGRFYISKSGNAVYESRYHRNV